MILFLLACVFSPYRIEQAVQNYDRHVLIDSLQNGRFGYERERAAIGLRRISPTKPIQTAIYSLRTCLSNTKEFDYVRKECAQTLGLWNDEQLPDLVADAIQDVDEESRYWMAFSQTLSIMCRLKGRFTSPQLTVVFVVLSATM